MMTMSNSLRERLITQARTVVPRKNWNIIGTLLNNAYIYNNEGVQEIMMYEPGKDMPGLIFEALTGSFIAPCGYGFIEKILAEGEKL